MSVSPCRARFNRPGDLEADPVVPPQWPTKSSLAGFLWELKTCKTNLLLQDCGFRTGGQSCGVWGSGQCWETRTLVPVSWRCFRLSAASGRVVGLREESPSRCLLRGLLGPLRLRGSVGRWRPVACRDSEALLQNVPGLCLHFRGLSRDFQS